jgi:hypothetical protein
LHPRREGDTVALVRGADAARACLAEREFVACPDVVHFPLFQYIPSITLGASGISDATIVDILAVLSTCSFVGIIIVTWRILRHRAGSGAAAVAVGSLVSGPLLWYVPSSFGEMLAALLVLLFIETLLARRRFIAVASTLWLAGITKETAIPFLLALGLAALLGPNAWRGIGEVRPQFTGLAVGALLVLVTNAGFNMFRFDSVRNVTLLQPLYRVPGLERRAEFVLGLWAAPNAGMLIFWPAAVLLFAVSVIQGLRSGWRRWPAVLLVGVIAGLTAGFASWSAPFGWYAWGSRLMMPWIPALLVLAIALYPVSARAFAEWLGRTRSHRIGAGFVASVLALPHLASLFPSDPYVQDSLVRLFAPDSKCPITPIIEVVTSDYYYGCTNHRAWEKTPVWLNSLQAVRGNAVGVAFAALLIVSFITAALAAPFGRDNGKTQT